MGAIARTSGKALTAGAHHLDATDVTRVVEGILEAQVRIENARFATIEEPVIDQLGYALTELRGAQEHLQGTRFVPGWDGFTERRRETKLRHASYAKRSES